MGKHQLANGSRKRQRHSRMTTSEIMTIIIWFNGIEHFDKG